MRSSGLTLAVLGFLASCNDGPETRNMSVNEVAAELANVQINPGLWESTSQVLNVTAPNLPRELQNEMRAPATTTRHCITPEQAARPDANFLATQQDNCAYRDFTMRGGRLQGTMVCGGNEEMPGEATAVMSGQYGPESYDMRTRMEMPVPMDAEIFGRRSGDAAKMTVETRATGRRLGECPEGEDSK